MAGFAPCEPSSYPATHSALLVSSKVESGKELTSSLGDHAPHTCTTCFSTASSWPDMQEQIRPITAVD
jgi:hypothetical protein